MILSSLSPLQLHHTHKSLDSLFIFSSLLICHHPDHVSPPHPHVFLSSRPPTQQPPQLFVRTLPALEPIQGEVGQGPVVIKPTDAVKTIREILDKKKDLAAHENQDPAPKDKHA